jgi:hypothetical protein
MFWLWYVAPVALLVVFFLTGLPGEHERRRTKALAAWRDLMTPKRAAPERKGDKKKKQQAEVEGPRSVTALPGDLNRLIPELGGGAPIARYELLEKLAYVVVMGPDSMNGSEYQAVLAKLEGPAPKFRARPLPILEGKRVPNTGIQFKKHKEFMERFLVEGSDAKKIGKWLTRALRTVLLDVPDAWLVVEGRAMALVQYGPVDAERLRDLVAAADTIFADQGAEGGPSLFFDEEDEPERKAPAKDEGEDEA